jgi:hypothetical protein
MPCQKESDGAGGFSSSTNSVAAIEKTPSENASMRLVSLGIAFPFAGAGGLSLAG